MHKPDTPFGDNSAAESSMAVDRQRDPLLCVDPLSGTSVFLAPRRGERPIELDGSSDTASRAEQRAACPFCLGHESLAPPDVLRLPGGASWRARVVPNRYPIVGSPSSEHVAGLPSEPHPLATPIRPARGIHEVLI